MITKITLMTAFLIVASYIVIPLPFAVASISLQTLAVNLIALLLSPFEACISIMVYILLCAVGVPVANGGKGGLTYLMGPTGGFFIGFLVAVVKRQNVQHTKIPADHDLYRHTSDVSFCFDLDGGSDRNASEGRIFDRLCAVSSIGCGEMCGGEFDGGTVSKGDESI